MGTGEREKCLRVNFGWLNVREGGFAMTGCTVGSQLVLVNIDVTGAAGLTRSRRLIKSQFEMTTRAQHVRVTGTEREDRVLGVIERHRGLYGSPRIGSMTQRAVCRRREVAVRIAGADLGAELASCSDAKKHQPGERCSCPNRLVNGHVDQRSSSLGRRPAGAAGDRGPQERQLFR